MGLIWGRQDPGGPHVGPVNFAILDVLIPIVIVWRPDTLLPPGKKNQVFDFHQEFQSIAPSLCIQMMGGTNVSLFILKQCSR